MTFIVSYLWWAWPGMEHKASTPFWWQLPAVRSKTRRQRQPTMENSVIAAAEAMRRCRIWHMRVARALDAH